MKQLNLIVKEYFRSFDEVEGGEKKRYEGKGRHRNWIFPPLSVREIAKEIFDQVRCSASVKEYVKLPSISGEHLWRDLDLLAGHEDNPERHLLGRIDRTLTVAGRSVLAVEIAHPHRSRAAIEEKQEAVRMLLAKKERADRLRSHLKRIGQGEERRALVWGAYSPMRDLSFLSSLNRFFYQARAGRRGMRRWYNLIDFDSTSSAWSLQVFKRFKEVVPLFGFFSFLVFGAVWASNKGRAAWGMVFLFLLAIGLLITYVVKGYLAYGERILSVVVAGMQAWQSLVQEAEKVSELIASDPDLEKRYGKHLVKTRSLLAFSIEEEEGQMIDLLRRLPLQNWSYFFSHAGRLLTLRALFEEHKACLGEMIYELGYLDVRLSTATLLEEGRQGKGKNGYVFSEVLEGKQPKIEGREIWHPILSPEEAVPNDIVMGGEVDPRTILITGPNAGGKSTYILALAAEVVMSQSLGIASAKKFVHSVIDDLVTYVNPTQNLAKGLSLAEAGFEMLKLHKKRIEKSEGVVLAIVDEILNGVDPEVAKRYSEQILRGRHEKYAHLLSVITTHYMNLPKLANQLDRFVNKKVEVHISGRFIDYTYKILEGVSDQNIVGKMLENKDLI